MILFASCRQENIIVDTSDQEMVSISGKTMGTHYTIIYEKVDNVGVTTVEKEAIDSVLEDLNQSVSTYIDQSLIGRINRADEVFRIAGTERRELVEYFVVNWSVAKKVYELSDGYFDPSVMPLVNYWGFGYADRDEDLRPSQTSIDSIKHFIGFDKFVINGNELRKPKRGQLDFSALAKGYGVDIVFEFLGKRGINNMMVEIGGEVRAGGDGRHGDGWNIGIAKPLEGKAYEETSDVLCIRDKAVATSGNYINFYEVDGNKYVHTINPHTGMSYQSNLLAVTVIMDKCIEADAWATALMSMGLESAKKYCDTTTTSGIMLAYNDNGELAYYKSSNFDDYQRN